MAGSRRAEQDDGLNADLSRAEFGKIANVVRHACRHAE